MCSFDKIFELNTANPGFRSVCNALHRTEGVFMSRISSRSKPYCVCLRVHVCLFFCVCVRVFLRVFSVVQSRLFQVRLGPGPFRGIAIFPFQYTEIHTHTDACVYTCTLISDISIIQAVRIYFQQQQRVLNAICRLLSKREKVTHTHTHARVHTHTSTHTHTHTHTHACYICFYRVAKTRAIPYLYM